MSSVPSDRMNLTTVPISVRVELFAGVPRMRSDDSASLDELQRPLLTFLLEKQARILEKGFAAHAHVTPADCAKRFAVSQERVLRAVAQMAIVYRDEPLAAARLLSTGCALKRGTVSDERVKVLILDALWSDSHMSDSALDAALRAAHEVELSFADLRRFRSTLHLSAEAAMDVNDALRLFAPCTWLREPFEARKSRPTNFPPAPGTRNTRAARGPVTVGRGVVPPPGYRYIERPLFPHQQEAIEAIEKWYAGGADKGILCLPTGGGKTKTAVSFLLKTALARGARCLWLAHRDELIEQAYSTFVESSHSASRPFVLGRWTSAEKIAGSPDVSVASIPTLTHQDDRGLAAFSSAHGSFDLCVVDECHHGAARTWRRLIEALRERTPHLRVLGLSATPTRTDESEVGWLTRHFGDVLYEVGTLPLIEKGILAKPRISAMNTGRRFDATPAERDAFEQFHDLPTGLVSRIADDTVRNEVIARAYLARRAEWGQTLIFAATIEQSKRLASLLRAEGVKVGEVYGESTANARVRVVEAFRCKDLDVVVNCGVFAEGTDLPSVRTVVLARPTRSRILFAQMVGRGMRGPATGGTSECNVVSFFDEVFGLMHAHLASGFRNEGEANEALGLTPVVETEEDGQDAADDASVSTAVALGEAAAVRSLFQAHALGPVDGCDASLLGWFEARSLGQRRYLPCFATNEQVSVAAWVAGRPGGPQPTMPSVPAAAIQAFLDFAGAPDVPIVWRGLDIAVTPEEVARLADDITLLNVETVAPLSIPPPFDSPVAATDLVEPEWWTYAEELAGLQPGGIVLQGGLSVSATSFAAAEKLWNALGGVVPPEDAPHLVGLVRTAAARQGGRPDEAEALVRRAIDSGSFPTRRERPQPPNHDAVIDFLDSRPKSEWWGILDILRASLMFVHPVASRRAFLLDLLRHTTEGEGA